MATNGEMSGAQRKEARRHVRASRRSRVGINIEKLLGLSPHTRCALDYFRNPAGRKIVSDPDPDTSLIACGVQFRSGHYLGTPETLCKLCAMLRAITRLAAARAALPARGCA